jgi:hypothetical protein
MDFWVLFVMVAMAELGLHYIPWKLMLRGRELPRIAAYTLGMLGMMVPLSAWLCKHNEVDVVGVLWAVIFTAGITVLTLYGFDHYLDLIMKDIEAAEREKLNGEKS